MTAAPETRLRPALADAARDARSSWRRRHTVWSVVFVAAALVPIVVSSPIRLQSWASGLYIALAAVGLNFAVGLGGLPSLGQGAFVGAGAFTTAALRVHAGWDAVPATMAGVALATVAGALVGLGAVRLRGVFVAVATWIVAWLLGFVLIEFPRLSGGSQGLVLPTARVGLPGTGVRASLTPGVHYEVALALLAVALVVFARVSRTAPGLALAAAREGPAQAAALGVDRFRVQLGAFTAAAVVGGLAGALAVQLAGVADPTAYGPLLSVELFVAVLVGGAGRVLGPVVGTAVLAAVPGAARGLGSFAGTGLERLEPVLAAALLIVAMLLGRGGLVGLAETAARRIIRARGNEAGSEGVSVRASTPADDPQPDDGAPLVARGVSKRFGGLLALDGVSVRLEPGRIHALVGPNGSGKSTLLRVLDGTVRPDAGAVAIGDRDLSDAPTEERVRAGVVRTLQRTVVFEDLTVVRHALAGATASRARGGAARAVLATPGYRVEDRALRSRAEEALELFGLGGRDDDPVAALAGGERRLLMVATALAARPRALLLDEPAAGMSAPETERLSSGLRAFLRRGVALLIVEHDFALVRLLAETVTVLDAGRVIAEGPAHDVAADAEVRAAYLGERIE